nr:MAG TPA: hypothetical protein [Caudoviricetes sp.]
MVKIDRMSYCYYRKQKYNRKKKSYHINKFVRTPKIEIKSKMSKKRYL